MRFITGPIPDAPDFHPLEEGWNAIREPDPFWIQILAIPVMAVTAVALFAVIETGTATASKDVFRFVGPMFLLMIPIHELIHAFANPRFGFTSRTAVGVWPSHLLFYAHYDGELPRDRFLAILVAPTVVLTVLPLLVCVAFRLDAPAVAALAVANGIGAAGDLLGVGFVLAQIPRGTVIRNKEWRSYWKPVSVL